MQIGQDHGHGEFNKLIARINQLVNLKLPPGHKKHSAVFFWMTCGYVTVFTSMWAELTAHHIVG